MRSAQLVLSYILACNDTHGSYDHRYNYQFLRNSYRLRAATLSNLQHPNPALGYRLFIYMATAGQLNVLRCAFSFVNKDNFHDADGSEKSSSLCILRIFFGAFPRFFSSSVPLFFSLPSSNSC